MKKTYLSIAAAAVISFAGATVGIAAELPTYEANGFPISPVQVGVLGAANVKEQAPMATSPASAQRPGVLKAAAVVPARTTGLSTR